LGFKTSDGWLSDMSGMLIISWLFCCLPVQLFCSGFFEIDSDNVASVGVLDPRLRNKNAFQFYI
ncbi:hypothetical protein VU07_02780, partial [Desulfobulbus sp. F4]|nr:hypothetical protein [Desulfobulbus sp. F4]